MSSTSKLEMSLGNLSIEMKYNFYLDEIIKAQKGKGGQAQGSNKKAGFIGRKIATNNRGRKFGSPKGKRQVGGAFKRQTNANPKSINQRKVFKLKSSLINKIFEGKTTQHHAQANCWA